MTGRSRARAAADAYKAGDMDALLDLALAYAQLADLAEELDRREKERKLMRTEQKRKERAVARRRATSQMSRDTSDTKILKQQQKLKSKESSPVADARESQGSRESPLPGVSWVHRLHGVWTSLAGAVQAGQVGKQLKPLVESRGVDAVEAGMRVYVAKRQETGAALNFGWFAADAVQWIDRALSIGVENGEMNGALELASRPSGVR